MREHVAHWILPSVVVGGLMAMHFSGQPLLQSIVAPDFSRELGLLENLQHAILLVILALAARRARHAEARAERAVFAIIAAGAAFTFLEEVDYGTHWWHALHGRGNDHIPFSIHNLGENSNRFKKAGDATMIALFAVFPLVSWTSRNRWIAFFRPSAWFLTSLAAMVLLSETAHALNDQDFLDQSSIRDSMSEFRELFVYWVWLVYLARLAPRPWPDADPPGA